jgi:hypothetical protein
MNLIRGALLAGRFRTHHALNTMSPDDQRNTLIVEMVKHSNQPGPHYQGMNDANLAGAAAVMVFIRAGKIRTDAELKTMSDDDQRNTLIVEINALTKLGSLLQSFSNIELVLLGLGKLPPGGLSQSSFVRGVLLAGGFRTHHDLIAMSAEDQRNTLIVEMVAHSNQPVGFYQGLNDFELAGVGAVMVFLRGAGIRDDAQLRTISADDQRSTGRRIWGPSYRGCATWTWCSRGWGPSRSSRSRDRGRSGSTSTRSTCARRRRTTTTATAIG